MLQNATIRCYYLQLNEYKTDYSVRKFECIDETREKMTNV